MLNQVRSILPMCVSIPAGAAPLVAFHAYRGIRGIEKLALQPNPTGFFAAQRYTDAQAKLATLHSVLNMCFVIFVVAGILHFFLLGWFGRLKNETFLGFRGMAWVVLLWAGFITGIGFGLIVCFCTPYD